MRSRKDFLAVALVLVLCGLAVAANTTMAVEPNTPKTDTNDANQMTFPYTAEVTGTDIYMRSGPGMNYYRCGKLSIPDKLEVVGSEYGWSKVVPPKGSFSWIAKEFVRIDSNNPDMGVITSNDVRIWAGSEYVEPMHSTSLQTKLNKGAKVKLLGEEKGDYYKIAPPEDAFLWINTQYIRYAGKASMPMAAEANVPAVKMHEANEPNKVVIVPKPVSIETQMLKKYREIAKQVEVERAKPLVDQNWASLKTELTAIADNNEAGKAAKYAKNQLDRVEAYELAQTASKTVQQQQAQLAQTKEAIEKKRQEELAKIPDMGRFAAAGTLKPSQLYAADARNRRYILTDESGKIIAYAIAEPSANVDVDKFINKKVGLVGKIERDQQSGSSLVRFTEIVEIK